MLPARLQFTLIIAIVVYFIMMCIFLKNKALSLKYTLLWIFAGIIMSLLVIVPDILVYLNHLVGIQDGVQSKMNGLFIWALFLLYVFYYRLRRLFLDRIIRSVNWCRLFPGWKKE